MVTKIKAQKDELAAMHRFEGGPAFPRAGFYSNDGLEDYETLPEAGMSLLDWYAGQVAPAVISAFNAGEPGALQTGETPQQAIARRIFDIAEAMVECRNCW